MSKPKANCLFHFTKTADALKSILKSGFFPRYCREDMSWFNMTEHIAYPVVCFCDIPLSRINEHTDFYGQYGLGMSKEWGLKNDLSPVVYCTASSLVAEAAKFLLGLNSQMKDKAEKEKLEKAFWALVKSVKPLEGKMYAGGGLTDKDFYNESEWRYTPRDGITKTVLMDNEYNAQKDTANKDAEKYVLKFLPSDIHYIFVKDDTEIPSVVDFINNNLGSYPLNDLKILNSRLISLTTVQRDL